MQYHATEARFQARDNSWVDYMQLNAKDDCIAKCNSAVTAEI